MGKKNTQVAVFDKKNALILLGIVFPASLGIGWLSGDIFISMFSDQPVIYFHWAATIVMFTPLVFFTLDGVSWLEASYRGRYASFG